jgi:hypothetical protein
VNDLSFVVRAVDLLASHGFATWVCGGWAEELRGLCPPRDHADLDLLYPAPGFERLDLLELDWVEAKRSEWKRAFLLDEVLVELLLVRRDADGWCTRSQRWPSNVFAAQGRVSVASADALASYRAWYERAA